MDTYCAEFEVSGKNKSFEKKLFGHDYLHLKNTFLDKVRGQCFLEKVSGEIAINVTFIKNGEYLDSDEGWAFVSEDYQKIKLYI